MSWLAWGLAASLLAQSSEVAADYVIQNVEIHDGSGGEARTGSLAIRGDRLVGIGEIRLAGEPRRIDGTGLIAAPGFIDLHTHCDDIAKEHLRINKNYLTQGVTTVVTGNCGGGPWDVAAYLRKIDESGAGTNVAHLIPHGAVRGRVMGSEKRAPTAQELDGMRELIDAGMRAGAWGMSTGLIYVPSCYAETDELVELSRVVGQQRGLYVSHIRSEGERLLEAITEALAIGQRAGVHVHISHFKASGREAWSLAAEAIRLVQNGRDAGQAATADQYPYIASSTSLSAMVVPEEYRSEQRLAEALADPPQAARVRDLIAKRMDTRSGGATLYVAKYAKEPSWQGKDLATLAREKNCSAVDLVLEIQQHGGAKMVNFGMQEADVQTIMKLPFVATASDGGCCVPDDTVPHPRNYGCFPRKIGRYAIEQGVVSLPAAIRSATGLPADIFGFEQRGYLREGYFADVVVFDPRTFRDTATFEKPHQYATGVRYLFVNGRLAIDHGQVTGQLAGRALRHAAR
jgi:N-acyl-D-aspartate/D-glutamate deacylase